MYAQGKTCFSFHTYLFIAIYSIIHTLQGLILYVPKSGISVHGGLTVILVMRYHK